MLALSALGVASLVSLVVRGGGVGASWAHLSSAGVALGAGMVLFALLFLAIRRVGMPLGDVVEAANRLAEGDFSTRLAEHGPPPVRVVAAAFNSMAARLQAQEEQRRHLMADIAHELRTPLTVIQGRLEGFLDGVYARDEAAMGEVLEETRLLARLVEDLRTLAHAEGGTLALHRETTDLAVLVHDVMNAFSAEAGRRQIAVTSEVPDLPLISLDPLRIREVLGNLLLNALQHTPAGGAVVIKAVGADAQVIVSVADNGAGIAAEDLSRIFDRFHKGATSRGSGLGLTIARNLVKAHGGDISAESHLGKGTTMTFSLPVE